MAKVKKDKKAEISEIDRGWALVWCREHREALAKHRGNIVLLHPQFGIINSAPDLDSSLVHASFIKKSIRAESAHVAVDMMLERLGEPLAASPKKTKRKVFEPPPGWTPPTDEEMKDILKKADFEEVPAKERFNTPSLSPFGAFDPEMTIDGSNRSSPHYIDEEPVETLAEYAKRRGHKATDVLLKLLDQGRKEININTLLTVADVTQLDIDLGPGIVNSETATSESLPRRAIESPHKQPPFTPRREPFDRGLVLDGYGRSIARGRGRID